MEPNLAEPRGTTCGTPRNLRFLTVLCSSDTAGSASHSPPASPWPAVHPPRRRNPAVVVRILKVAEQRGKVDAAAPQLTEEPVAKRRPGSPSRSRRARSAIGGSQSLKWTCHDARAVARQQLDRSTLRRRSHGRNRGTDRRATDRSAASVRRSRPAFPRSRRSGGGTPCAGPRASRTARGNSLDTSGRIVPLAPGEAQGRVNAAGRAGAGRDPPSARRTTRSRAVRRRRSAESSRAVSTAVCTLASYERGSARRVVTNAPTMARRRWSSSFSEHRGLGGHEAPVAELGAGVSACGDLVEHLFIARAGALRLELQHAPRAGRIGDSDQEDLLRWQPRASQLCVRQQETCALGGPGAQLLGPRGPHGIHRRDLGDRDVPPRFVSADTLLAIDRDYDGRRAVPAARHL